MESHASSRVGGSTSVVFLRQKLEKSWYQSTDPRLLTTTRSIRESKALSRAESSFAIDRLRDLNHLALESVSPNVQFGWFCGRQLTP